MKQKEICLGTGYAAQSAHQNDTLMVKCLRWMILLSCFLLLTGCQNALNRGSESGTGVPASEIVMEHNDHEQPITEALESGKLTYSNLVGENVQNCVRNVMTANGIDDADADKFFVWVNDFNQVMGDCESYALQDEFVTIDAWAVDYGEYYPMSQLWYKQNQRRYSDILCRIAAFQLVKKNIVVSDYLDRQEWECDTEDQWLCSDWDAISNFSLIDFSEEEISRYFTLYAPIAVAEGSSEEEIYQAIAAEWKNRTVVFQEGNISLVTIWTQAGSQTAASHAAVLIQDQDILWLTEKTNPQAPYQVSKFSSMEQIRQYMYESIRMENERYGFETGVCVVLQNDCWLK